MESTTVALSAQRQDAQMAGETAAAMDRCSADGWAGWMAGDWAGD